MKFKHSLWPHNELKKLVKIAALIYFLCKKYTRINTNTHTHAHLDTRTNTQTYERRFNEFIEHSSCIVKFKKKKKQKTNIFAN